MTDFILKIEKVFSYNLQYADFTKQKNISHNIFFCRFLLDYNRTMGYNGKLYLFFIRLVRNSPKITKAQTTKRGTDMTANIKTTKAQATKTTKAQTTKGGTDMTANIKTTKAQATKTINAKAIIIAELTAQRAEINARKALYADRTHKTIIEGLGTFAALRNAAQKASEEHFHWLASEAGIEQVTNCEEYVKALKILKFYPKHWPTPNSVYNGAMARKNQGRNSAWKFDESAPNGGIVKNLDDESMMFLFEFLSVWRLCKLFAKREELAKKAIRQTELHGAVMKKVAAIEKAIKRENPEELAEIRAALKVALDNAKKAKVAFTPEEQRLINEALNGRTIPAPEKTAADYKQQIATAQAEAGKKAQAEYEKRLAEERAKRLAAEKELAKNAEERAKFAEERQKLGEQNAKMLAAQNEAANKYKRLLPLLECIPKTSEELATLTEENMREFLANLVKQI